MSTNGLVPAQALMDFLAPFCTGAAAEVASPGSTGSNLANAVAQMRHLSQGGNISMGIDSHGRSALRGDDGVPAPKKAKRAAKGECTLSSVLIYGAVCETQGAVKLSTLVATPSAPDAPPSCPVMYADRIYGPVGKVIFVRWLTKIQISKTATKEQVVHQFLLAAFPDASPEAYTKLAKHVCLYKQETNRMKSKGEPSLPVHVWANGDDLYSALNRGQTR